MLLENEYLRIKTRALGGELTSIFSKKHNVELLWQADSAVWPWHAPNLFPVVGSCYQNNIYIGGKAYPMARHGFLRNSICTLKTADSSAITWFLEADAQTQKQYPFAFRLEIHYHLDASSVRVTYTVSNQDKKPMYFSIGAHPAFVLPGFGNYFIKLHASQPPVRHLLNAEGLFSGETETLPFEQNILELTPELFEKDAIVFKSIPTSTIEMYRNDAPVAIRLEFAGFTDFGIWSKPGSIHFVCLEPWLGCADMASDPIPFEQKYGIQKIEPNALYQISYQVYIEDVAEKKVR